MSLQTPIEPRLRRPTKRRLLLAVAGAGLLYAVVWVATAFVLADQIETWTMRERADGNSIKFSERLVSGFPGRVVLTFPDWEFSRPSQAGGWTWRTKAVRVSAAPWQPLALAVDLAGRHEITGALTPPTILTAERADITPGLLADGRLRAISAAIDAATLADSVDAPPWAALGRLRLSANPSETPPPDSQPAWHLALEIAAVRWPETLVLGPFARELDRAIVDAQLIGEIAPGPLTESLDAWRRGGGTLDLRRFELAWPPLGLSGSATVALDSDLQPIGSGTVKFTGLIETIDTMAEQGTMPPTSASAARVMLGLMARTPGGGKAPEINLSLTVQNGKLSAGPLPLLELPPIDWSTVSAR